MNLSKKCGKCRQFKVLTCFAKDAQKKDGLANTCRTCQKTYYQQNRERIREAQKLYRIANRLSVYAISARWREANRERTNELNRLSYHRRKHIPVPPRSRISRNMKSRMYYALKRNKQRMSWEYVVGYNVTELMAHLEAQFADGMNWDNYGQWEIDHIRPIATFEFR